VVLLHEHREVRKSMRSGRAWKGPAKRVTPPYVKQMDLPNHVLSTLGHVEPRGNLGGPSSKTKYYLTTDSELVP
jgi:hypothetical protein